MRRVRRQDAASGSTDTLISNSIVSPTNTDPAVPPTGPTTTPTTTQTSTTSTTSTTPTSTHTSSSSSSSGSPSSGSSTPPPSPDQRNDPPNTTDESITQVFTSMSGTRLVTVTAVVPNPSASLQHSGGPVSFWDNRGAVIATFTLVGIAVVAILGVAITASFRRKRRNRGGSHGEIPRDSHFLDDDDNDSRFYQALSEKSAVSAGISPAAASFSEKWGSGPTRHPYASPPVGADLRRTMVELPVEPVSRPPSAFLSLHLSTRPPSLMPSLDPSMFPPGPHSANDDHILVRPASAAWDHPNNPGHPFSAAQLNRSASQNRSLPTLPDQPHHQHAPALQHSRQFSDPQLLNRMSQMVPEPSSTSPLPSPNANRHHSFGADAMLGLSADPRGMPPNRHHSLGSGSLLMPMSSRTPSPQPSNYDASMYSRTPGSSADYGTRRIGTGDWSAPGYGHSPSQSIGSNYTYMPPPPPPNGYERTRDPRFSGAFGATPTRSGTSLAHSGASASLGQVQQAYYAHPPYAHPHYVSPTHDPRHSGMMMGGRHPGTGSSASVAYTYAQSQRPPTSQSFYSKKTASRPGTGESDTTTSSEQQQIQYLQHPEDISVASSVTTHVDDLERLPAVSATSLQTTTTETRAEGSGGRDDGAARTDRSKTEGPPFLYLPGDDQPKDISDATSLKDDVDYTPGWIGALLIANE